MHVFIRPPRLQKSGFLCPNISNNENITSEDTLRIQVSTDTGWSKRGSGFQYDSLNGYTAIIGKESSQVLDFITCNRKCRLCDIGHSKEDHDCRKNFYGSAKAMEPYCANKLVNDSSVLKSANLEVGIVVGDNDSTSIASIKKNSTHEVVKFSDINHTSKGVKSMLYKLSTDRSKDPDKELTTDAIKYLHRCFTYALHQHKGNVSELSVAIKNIPCHVFNYHENCGQWCGFIKNPKNYNHKVVSEGFKNEILFNELQILFSQLSNNSEKFVAGGSSQANESLNGAMSKKCPKSLCYSTSESADFRFALTVGEKNKRRGFVQNVISKLGMNSSKHLSKYVKYANTCASKRRKKAQTQEFKHRRNILQKQRTLLKNRKETTEGNTYESNISLFDVSINKKDDNSVSSFECTVPKTFTSAAYTIVFFDLETSGLHLHCNILQIAMKCGVTTFNMYINPNTPVSKRVSIISGLSWVEGELYLHGLKVQSHPLKFVLKEMLNVLKNFNKRCILVAHNCSFAPRLICNIKNSSLLDDFNDVIIGFCDILVLIKKQFPEKRKKEQCTLRTLADELSLPIEDVHDASHNVYLLEQISLRHLNTDDIVNNYESFTDVVNKVEHKVNATKVEHTFKDVQDVFSKTVIKRLATTGISYNDIVSTFKNKGKEYTISLLQGKFNGKATLVKTKKDLDAILKHVTSL